jgi:hypothetical protein
MQSEKASDALLTVPTIVANTKRLSRSEDGRGIWRQFVCGAIAHHDITDRKGTLNEMLIYLQGRGYAVAKVRASYLARSGGDGGCADDADTDALSYLVFNYRVQGDDGGQLRKDLVALGRRHNLDAVLVSTCGWDATIDDAVLIGTSSRDGACPAYAEEVVVKDSEVGATALRFLERLLDEQLEGEFVQPMQTINGIRGQQIFVRELAKEIGLDDG